MDIYSMSIDMPSLHTIMLTYVFGSMVVMYNLYYRYQSTSEDVESLEKRVDFLSRNLKFYKYCFQTQKKAETVYSQELSDLRRENSMLSRQLRNLHQQMQEQEQRQAEELEEEIQVGNKRTATPVFTMTLRQRDETGKVKRRKISDDSDTESDTEEEVQYCVQRCECKESDSD